MNTLNKTTQRIAEESFDSVWQIVFRNGQWVISSPAGDGRWEEKEFTGKIKFDFNSTHDGYIAFTLNDDDSPGGVLREYATGDEDPIKPGDLPEVRYRMFGGEIREDNKGWQRSIRVDGISVMKVNGESVKQPVRFTSHGLSGVRAVQFLIQETINRGDGTVPVAKPTSATFTARDGQERAIPKFEIVSWAAESEPIPEPKPEPPKVEDAGSLNELEETVNAEDWT